MKSFQFWPDNSLDKEYTLTESEIKEKYLAFLNKRPILWVHHNYDLSIYDFIGSVDGLNSVNDPKELIDINAALRPVLRQFVNDNKPPKSKS